jgi:hypothetical protein
MAMAERPEYWVAWLVDGEGGQLKRAAESLDLIEAEIKNRRIPRTGDRAIDEGIPVNRITVNMWWRSDTPALHMKSEMDGDVVAHVAVQDYGSSLYVYLKLLGAVWDANWAKRMHFQAFRSSLTRAVEDALGQLPGNPKISNIEDISDLQSESFQQ